MKLKLKIKYNAFIFIVLIAIGCCKELTNPSITTLPVTERTQISAVSGGNVTNNGGADVTARGVCWNTSQNPTVSLPSKTIDGAGNGSFESSLTGLTQNTLYFVRAYATNSEGTAYGEELTFTTSSTVPGAPTSVSAIAGIAQATVTFTAPVSNGGSAITGYTVTSSPGSKTGAGSASPIIVTGLTPGTAYTFTVVATNINGNSLSSAASNSVMIPTVPGPPTSVSAIAGNSQATITFLAPASNGGYTITGYTATSNPGSFTGTSTSTTITVTGLTNGTAYTFTVTATNAIGTGPASAASNSVMLPTVPGPPTGVSAIAGNSQATITFIAPASNGGSTITGYTVTSNPGNKTATGSASPITVTGLTNLIAYTFTVVATNINGPSFASSASNSVIPGTVTNPSTGKIWMDRNLGASQVATSSTDANSYGHLYQWGRGTDGHQVRTSGTTTTLSSSSTPGHGNFIIVSASPYDWRSPQNTSLWQGVNGVNNPCPTGYRLATEAELNAERLSWSTSNATGAYASPLKLTMAGSRNYSDGSVNFVGSFGNYWSSTVSSTDFRYLVFSSSNAYMFTNYRAYGGSVRCIKD